MSPLKEQIRTRDDSADFNCGHPRTPANTKYRAHGRGANDPCCRECDKRYKRDMRQRQKVARLTALGMCRHCIDLLMTDQVGGIE